MLQFLKLDPPPSRASIVWRLNGMHGVDEVYRDYRIAVKLREGWIARITHVSGRPLPVQAHASVEEGADKCLARARVLVDRYVAFLGIASTDGEAN